MPVDLDKIRALLASVSRFTEGPWIAIEYAANDAAVAVAETHPDKHEHPGALIVGQTDARDARLIAAAPDLHRELTEAVAEIERLRLVVGWAEADALGTSNALALVTEQAKKDCAERDTEIERLRAHNARMAHRLTAIADACAYADETGDRGSIWEAVSNVVAAGSGKSLRHVEEVLRRLAAGEVDDG